MGMSKEYEEFMLCDLLVKYLFASLTSRERKRDGAEVMAGSS